MITYQVEDYVEAVPELRAIYPEHWEEIALDRTKIVLNPDYDKYEALAKSGMLHLVTARNDGELAGYHLSIISPHLHYMDSLTCFTDIFFVRKKFRSMSNGMVGLRLFRFLETSLKDKGVQKIYMGTKLHLDLDPILKRLGYKPIERLYTKLIG